MDEVRVPVLVGAELADDDELGGILEELEGEGVRLDVPSAPRPSPADQARDLVSRGHAIIVAVGGDGTLNAVVRGVLEGTQVPGAQRVAVGLLPRGTANDFAEAACLPTKDPAAALRLVARVPPRDVDVASVNGRPFMNVASGGSATRFTRDASPTSKKLLGRGAYLLSAILHWSDVEPQWLEIVAQEFRWEGEALFVGFGNARTAGGGAPVSPDALIDDGALDLLIVPASEGVEWAAVIKDLVTTGAEEARQHFVTARVSRATMRAPGGLALNLDGEPLEDESFDIEVASRRLPFLLPRDCPLLSTA